MSSDSDTDSDLEMEHTRCARCQVKLPHSKFTQKRCGNYMKQCDECRRKDREYRKNTLCPHKKINQHVQNVSVVLFASTRYEEL